MFFIFVCLKSFLMVFIDVLLNILLLLYWLLLLMMRLLLRRCRRQLQRLLLLLLMWLLLVVVIIFCIVIFCFYCWKLIFNFFSFDFGKRISGTGGIRCSWWWRIHRFIIATSTSCVFIMFCCGTIRLLRICVLLLTIVGIRIAAAAATARRWGTTWICCSIRVASLNALCTIEL